MSSEDGVLRIHADPAGAANVMREVVARPRLSARLVEGEGNRWQVVVQTEGAGEHEHIFARMLDLLVRSFDEGRLQFATLEFDGRMIEIGPWTAVSRPRPSTRPRDRMPLIERHALPSSAHESGQPSNNGSTRRIATTAEPAA